LLASDSARVSNFGRYCGAAVDDDADDDDVDVAAEAVSAEAVEVAGPAAGLAADLAAVVDAEGVAEVRARLLESILRISFGRNFHLIRSNSSLKL
jgi:hypothetical protein